jgi:hypothetical protein
VAEPEDFIVYLPDSVTTDRVFNGGPPFHAPGFSLFFRRWTRVAHGQAAVLPSFIQVELRGIPVHAWRKDTMQQLLGKACWVQSVEANTTAQQDLVVFRVSAWCRQPDLIPAGVDLFIPDPVTAGWDQSMEKPGISYPVKLRVVVYPSPEGSPPSPPDEPDQGRRRRHRRCHRSSPPRLSSVGAHQAANTPLRPPVHTRLGPTTSHMELLRSSSTCKAPRTFNAVSPDGATPNASPSSPVSKAATELMMALPTDNRCGTRDEEDLPGSVPSSLVPCDGHAWLQSSNGPPLGGSGPDRPQVLPSSPELHQEQAQQEDFSDRTPASFSRVDDCQVFGSVLPQEASGGSVEDLAVSIASILPAPTTDTVNGPSSIDDDLRDCEPPAVAAAAGTQLLVYSHRQSVANVAAAP